MIGAEALVRWRHPEHGLMPPAAFLPLAERAGLMGRWPLLVLDEAIAPAARGAPTATTSRSRSTSR